MGGGGGAGGDWFCLFNFSYIKLKGRGEGVQCYERFFNFLFKVDLRLGYKFYFILFLSIFLAP